MCLWERFCVKVRNTTSICVSVWEQPENSCEVIRRQTKRGSLATGHCSSAQLGNTNRWSACVRVSVCICVLFMYSQAHSGTCAVLTRGPRCLSALRTHSPTLRGTSFYLCLSFTNRQDGALGWNQYLATGSQSVWSPTSFSASVGRKWPNTQAPVLRWTHCCHIKAQICTVAQLKFPTLRLLRTPSPTPLEQMAELNNCLFWAPWREYSCPLISMEESNQRTY